MPDWSRIGKLIGMLGSEHDGERLNAARLLDRTLKGEGASFGDLSQRVSNGLGGSYSAPRTIIVEKPARPNPARDIAEKVLKMAGSRAQHSERRFLNDIIRGCDMTGGCYELTVAQANWLSLLEKQYCVPKPRVFKTVKPGPIPTDVLDDLGLGERPGAYKGEAVMPDARDVDLDPVQRVIRRKHRAAVNDPSLDEMGLGEDRPDGDKHTAVKERFGNLDIEGA